MRWTFAAVLFAGCEAEAPLPEPPLARGDALTDAGDVDGDGDDELIVASPSAREGAGVVYVFRGTAKGLEGAPAAVWTGSRGGDAFGASVSGAGDLDGDGFDDVAVGAPGAGTISVYRGSVDGLVGSPWVTIEGEGFGSAVASVGDVDGDGFGDLAMASARAVALYRGGRDGLTAGAIWTGGDGFGVDVAPAGDLDGDGLPEVLVGGVGQAWVFKGDREEAWASLSGAEGFGTAVDGAGDIDGDGFGDIVVAAPYADGGVGAATIYRGSASGVTAAGLLTAEPWGGMGLGAIAGAGDIDGDGFAAVVIGASLDGDPHSGAAYVYLGSAAGLSGVPSVTLSGAAAEGFVGSSVANAGDIDGDGHSDVVFGACGFASGYGTAFVYGRPAAADP